MQKKLRVIFTADCHGYLYPSDYFGTQEERMGMLSVIAAFRRDENTLVIDGGDTIQGSPFTDYLNRSGIGPKRSLRRVRTSCPTARNMRLI